MKILVYVEGLSDVAALKGLLQDLILDGRRKRVGVAFHSTEGKDRLLDEVPRKAAAHLASSPGDWVFTLPDLYPMARFKDTKWPHLSAQNLKDRLAASFESAADRHRIPSEARHRFRPHCLKHDLETLILAVPDELRRRLGTRDKFGGAWRCPVEDQNDHRPPKRVVEDLFKKYRKQRRKYIEIQDAPAILKAEHLESIRNACLQCFGPFVADLVRAIESGGGGR